MYHKRRRRRRASSTAAAAASNKGRKKSARAAEILVGAGTGNIDQTTKTMIHSPVAVAAATAHDDDEECSKTIDSEPNTIAVPASVLSPASSSSDKDNHISSTTGGGGGGSSVEGAGTSTTTTAGTLTVTGAAMQNTGAGAGGMGQPFKAVGARKRKSTPMLKIENKTSSHISSSNGMMTPLSDNEDDDDDDEDHDEEDEDDAYRGARSRNGNGLMIRSILTELKSAKSGLQGVGRSPSCSPTKSGAPSEQQDVEDHEGEDEDVEIDDGEGNDTADCRDGTKNQSYNNKIGGGGSGEDVLESGVRLLRTRTVGGVVQTQPQRSTTVDSLSIVPTAASGRRGRKPKQISSTTKYSRSQSQSSKTSHRRNQRRFGANREDEDSYSDGDEDEDMEGDDDAHNNNNNVGQRHGHGHGHGHDDEIGEQSCTLCAYTCPDKSTMLRHMRKHSGERPFQCRLCSFGFTTKANCERHLKNRHGQVDKDHVRSLIECHLVTTSSMDGSISGASSNDETSHQAQIHGQGQSHGRQARSGGMPEDNEPTTIKPFSVKHMLSNTNPVNSKSQLHNATSGLFTPASVSSAATNSLFMPPVNTNLANELLHAKSPYLLSSLHPMFMGGGGVSPAAAQDFPGLTLANAHSGTAATGAAVKRNIFLESMTRGHPLFGGAGAFEQLKSAAAAASQQVPLSLTSHIASTPASDNGPLDLSMDAMDLSVKRERSSQSNLSRSSDPDSNPLLKPKAMYPSDNFSTGLITSPYISKRDPIVPLNFSSHGGQSAAADLKNLAGAAMTGGGIGAPGVPFPIFPFGPTNSHLSGTPFPFGLRAPSDMDKFIGMSLAAGPGNGGQNGSKNHSIPFLATSSPSGSIGNVTNSTKINNFGGSSVEVVADRDRDRNGMGSIDRDRDRERSVADIGSGGRRASLSSNNSVSVSVPRPASYKSSSASPNPAVSSSRHGHGHGHKRAEKRRGGGGDYQKPKQRRYRTERPFSCPHCPAKFTLRSNMERHGKHQHPNVWQRSPSNRVINRQKNLANQQSAPSPLLSSPTMVPSSKYSSINGFDYGHGQGHSASKLLAGAALKDKPPSTRLDANAVNIRAVIAQQLKRKMSGTNLRLQEQDRDRDADHDHDGTGASDEDVDMEDAGENKAQDLASVSQLLNRAKSSNFSQYFAKANSEQQSEGSASAANNGGGSETESNEDQSDGSSDEQEADDDHEEEENENEEDDEQEVEEEYERGGGSERERKRYKLVNGEKKKSAYSSAPHKISCPHCTRRFPWTSSLRRHLLTHTGQKPYQCSKCPLLFTTKSNCDRHLVRKHNAKRAAAANANAAAVAIASGGEGSASGEGERLVIIRGKRGRRKGKRNEGLKITKKAAVVVTPDDDGIQPGEGGGSGHEEDTAVVPTSSEASTPVTTPRPGRPPKNKPTPATASEFLHITPKNACAAAAALNSSNGSTSPGEDVAFRCHLCDASAVERDILLAHMEEDHKETFHLLLAKGALVNSPPSPPTDTSESEVTPPGRPGSASAGERAGGTSTPTPTGDQKDVTHRKVMCVFCVRRFWSVEDLRRHIRSHSGERPFSCPYCSRRFTLKHSMLRHIKKHENSNSSSAAAAASLAGLNNNNELTITPILPTTGPCGKRTRIGTGAKHSSSAATMSSMSFERRGDTHTPDNSDLIGKLLGINDESLVEELLSKSDAKGAAELLGLGVGSSAGHTQVVSSSTN